MIRTYTDLIKFKSFKERCEYLKLDGEVAKETFGYKRYLNQQFYKSNEWLRVRSYVISRDLGMDLGVMGHDIPYNIIVHHMNPITQNDIIESNLIILDPEFLICTSKKTHDYIHYGKQDAYEEIHERKPNDTCPWIKE